MELPLDRSPASLADWVELELLLSSSKALSATEIQARLAEEPGPGRSKLHSQSDEDEYWSRILSDLWRELNARARRAGEAYPFVTAAEDVSLIGADWRSWRTYTFLVAVAARHLYRFDVSVNATARLFEYVVTCALANYLPGQARRVGWPYERGEPGFEERTRRLAEVGMREPWGGLTGVSPDVKDHGLDVIAWRSFEDGRPGQPIILCQCATGTDFWDKKVDDAAWRLVINFVVRPTPAIAFPVIPQLGEPWERSKWVGVSISGGLLFDRIRIATYAGPQCLVESPVAAEFDAWLADCLPKLASAMPRTKGDEVPSREPAAV